MGNREDDVSTRDTKRQGKKVVLLQISKNLSINHKIVVRRLGKTVREANRSTTTNAQEIFTMARFSLALFALAFGSSNAFAPHSLRTPAVSSATTTVLQANTKVAAPTVTTYQERTSYAEESRPYRRTVFTHDDWVRHRSSDRFRKSNALVLSMISENSLTSSSDFCVRNSA